MIFAKQGPFCMNSPQRVASEIHGELEDSELMNFATASFCSPGELFRSESVTRHGVLVTLRSELAQDKPVISPWRAGNSPRRAYTEQPATF
ncbi:hypothetical protein QL285_044481 [Trifolium repens]|nr:hypothetical protein QL285_044481 [Trifolium repens]